MIARPTALLLLASLALTGCGHSLQTMTTPAGGTSASAQAYMPPDTSCGGSGSGGFHGGGGMPHIRAIGPVGPANPGGHQPTPAVTPIPCRTR